MSNILLSLCIADEEQYRPCIKNLEHKMKITQPMLVDMTEINFAIYHLKLTYDLQSGLIESKLYRFTTLSCNET